MSDSWDFTVTYTAVSSPFGGLSNIRSLRVDGPPVMPEDPYAYVVATFQAPPSPDYLSGPEYPLAPDFVPEPVYPEFMPPEDEVLPAEEQPLPTLPPSPLSPWSSPLPQIPSPPLPPILSPLPVSSPPPASPTYPLGYRAAMIRLRAEAPSTSRSPPPHIILSHTIADTPPSGTPPSRIPPLLPIPLPASSLSLLLPSADHGADKPEVCLPPRKRLCFAFGPRYEVGESSSAADARLTRGFRADYCFVATVDKEVRHDLERDVGYGITDTWDEMLVDMPGALATNDTELGRRMTKFTTRVSQDTDEIYTRLDDEQTERQLMAGRLNMLYKDRRAHARIALLMEREARMSQEAWGRSMDASDLARSEVMSLRTTVLGQQAVITELQAADRRRQTLNLKLLHGPRIQA
ncbi:hypothetical protein Tco_0007010 [Tanacetum coccineum]